MRVKGKACRSQVIEGTISATELLALVRETFAIPDHAEASFHVIDPGSLQGRLGMQVASGFMPANIVQVTDGAPVHFRITWSLPVGKDEQG
ncbi:MAG TPA: hypothetical protein VFM95_02685 [Microcella sp.]|nr:hypothetical protein [Microcella sp.]